MLYSLGHSTHSQADFEALTSSFDIVLDVRSHPTSKWPQFDGKAMAAYLGNRYVWAYQLGGWTERHLNIDADLLQGVPVTVYGTGAFPKQRIAKSVVRTGEKPSWTNLGLWDYSIYMTLPEFLAAADDLIIRARTSNIAMFCCELEYWRCHRSLIADYCAWRSVDVLHVMPRYRQKNKVKYIVGARYTSHWKILGNRIERYDPYVLDCWDKWRANHPHNPHILGCWNKWLSNHPLPHR